VRRPRHRDLRTRQRGAIDVQREQCRVRTRAREEISQGGIMPLIQLIVILIVIGLILYLVESLLPLDPAIKQVIRVVIVLAVILWLLSLVGLIPARISRADGTTPQTWAVT
jgi:hypothetical protein